jgi:hypothetical protein
VRGYSVKLVMRMRTGFKLLRMGPVVTSCGQRIETSQCIKAMGFHVNICKLLHCLCIGNDCGMQCGLVCEYAGSWVGTNVSEKLRFQHYHCINVCEEIYMKGKTFVTLGLAILHTIA